MNIKRIEEIQKETAYPDSISVQQALLKVWNECEQEKAVKNNAVLPLVSGSTLLPDGWKVYKCTDCQEINVKKDNRQITVGFCDNCEHPLWNDDVD